MTTTTQTAAAARTNALTILARAIEAKGFTTEIAGIPTYPRLRVSHPSIGLVASLKTTSLRLDGFGKLVGSVGYDGRLFSQRDSEFALLHTTTGLPSVSNIVARLRRDLPLVVKQSAEQAAYRAREASDAALLATLPTVEGAQVSVFDGKVDINLNDITPAQAAAVLAALAS